MKTTNETTDGIGIRLFRMPIVDLISKIRKPVGDNKGCMVKTVNDCDDIRVLGRLGKTKHNKGNKCPGTLLYIVPAEDGEGLDIDQIINLPMLSGFAHKKKVAETFEDVEMVYNEAFHYQFNRDDKNRTENLENVDIIYMTDVPVTRTTLFDTVDIMIVVIPMCTHHKSDKGKYGVLSFKDILGNSRYDVARAFLNNGVDPDDIPYRTWIVTLGLAAAAHFECYRVAMPIHVDYVRDLERLISYDSHVKKSRIRSMWTQPFIATVLRNEYLNKIMDKVLVCIDEDWDLDDEGGIINIIRNFVFTNKDSAIKWSPIERDEYDREWLESRCIIYDGGKCINNIAPCENGDAYKSNIDKVVDNTKAIVAIDPDKVDELVEEAAKKPVLD